MKLSSLNKRNIISSMRFCIMIPVALLARKWKPNVWLISERSTQARDNGYCFFKYLREQQPQCDVFYIIDKKAQDYKKIEKYGNVIQYDSWKHYFYYCLSKIHISAHVGGCAPSNSPICRRIKRILNVKDVFIPHGVSYGIAEFCLQKYTRIDLFICSGKTEYENVLKNYGYQQSEVAYTGFPRLDQWHNIKVNPKQIVLMPTWRLYLEQNPETVIENTEYFRRYQELILDEDLQKFLIQNNLRLIFYLHHNMQKYTDKFVCNCENIEVVYDEERYDIQELLKSSALLITDYSSVHFDFAYMKKPVIYYQFDREEFFNKQYKKGLFEAEKNGFGPVAYRKEQLVNEVIRAYKNNFQMGDIYYKRMREFYQLYDNKNCERVYEAICHRFVEN